jgi:colanic acid/amylovoran biosynthesis glycosyltransferase
LAIAVFHRILTDSRRGKLKRLVKNLLVLKYPVDLVYFPWLLSVGDFGSLMAAGVPGLVSCRGAQVSVAPFNPLRPGVRETLQEAFRFARRVHCVSHAILKEAAALGLRESKAEVIPPAVDVDLFNATEDKKTSTGNFEIVTTGSLIWRKGSEFALTAVRLMLKNGIPVHYTIIGDGPERQRILYTVLDLGLSGRVHLTGSLQPEKVSSFLQKANVFFLSSLSEGISNALLEAMACGLPVVCTDCAGISEAVTHKVDGYLVPVQDPVAAADALSLMYANKSLMKDMGNAARQKVLKEHALDTQITRFKKLMESTAAPIHRSPLTAR